MFYRQIKNIKYVLTTMNGTIRKLGYDFMFAFHSDYSPILYHFRDKAIYSLKNRKFCILLAFDALVTGSLSE